MSRSVPATCSHHRAPAMLLEVSSTCTTCASTINDLISFSVSASAAAASPTALVTQPVDGRAPVRSAISCAVRATGTWWNTSRYTASARRLGPYWVGPRTPGGASARVTAPQPHRRRCSRCSVTTGWTGGMSWTWRRTTPTGSPPRAAPQPRQQTGRCSTTSSGSSTSASVLPGEPGCLPGRRPEPRRPGSRGGTCGPSAEGGREEFRELRASRRSSSATRAVSSSIIRACSTTSASNCSRDASSSPDTRRHDHPSAITNPAPTHRRSTAAGS